MNTTSPLLHWLENDQQQTLRWHSEAGASAPKRVQIADDRLSADTAYRLACEGTALLWRGDFQNAKQLLQALARRVDRKPNKPDKPNKTKKADQPNKTKNTADATALPFHHHRQAQAQRARVLAMLLIPLEADYGIPLKRAPDVRQACADVLGAPTDAFVMSLRELLGMIGAHQWRKNGVQIPALAGKITPHYGVYSPVRGEYLELVAKAPLPAACNTDSDSDTDSSAFDIGTGTGVLACILAQRGLQKIVATDLDPRALACAAVNIHQLKLDQHISLQACDLFPAGKAGLIVCNPPWLPVRPNSPIERAIYDPDSRMLRSFLAGVATHLLPGGAAWLIMSNFAELLGLRGEQDLWNWIDAGGLQVAGKMDIKPQHPKSTDANDPLHQARSAEITSLWRLTLK
ncbi:MAG: class I SAM-dependent methyltransferase [Burkholderiaceae bacterium]|nr:class I SAM-dependent methyltransferase [Burkholderiaceae bacterium]